VLLGLEGPTGGYRLIVSAKEGGGDRLALAVEGAGNADVTEEIAKRFKSQTLISADEIVFADHLEEGPLAVDERE
jgi:phenylacetate-CoA ligase